MITRRSHRGFPFQIDVREHGARIEVPGRIELGMNRRTDKPWYTAAQAFVYPEQRRLGGATAAYELALELACSEKRRLLSDVERSHFSEAFWRKQARKGRARCAQRNKDQVRNVWMAPLDDALHDIEEVCRREPDFLSCMHERMKPLLVLPRAYRGRWPCFRWGFKRAMCKEKQPTDLKGLSCLTKEKPLAPSRVRSSARSIWPRTRTLGTLSRAP